MVPPGPTSLAVVNVWVKGAESQLPFLGFTHLAAVISLYVLLCLLSAPRLIAMLLELFQRNRNSWMPSLIMEIFQHNALDHFWGVNLIRWFHRVFGYSANEMMSFLIFASSFWPQDLPRMFSSPQFIKFIIHEKISGSHSVCPRKKRHSKKMHLKPHFLFKELVEAWNWISVIA